MFDAIFKILYALFLFVAGIIISVRNNIFVNRNNNNNHVILVEEDVVENERRTVINNNNNNNDVIYNILNPNNDDTDIDITGNTVISQVTDDSQIFDPTLSLLRDSDQLSENNPIYRIFYNERIDGNNRNIVGFVARDNLGINFRNPENPIMLGIGTNIIRANRINVHSTLILSITLNNEGLMGGLRGIGENPELSMFENGRLNIILDENSFNNLTPNMPYIIMSEFDMLNEDRNRVRLATNNINNLIGYFLGNNYAISLVENNNNNIIVYNNIVRHVLNPNNNNPVYITGNATISLLENNSQLFGTIISIFENNSQQFGNHPVFMVSYNEIAEYAASFFMRNNSEIWFENNSDNEITIVLRNSITTNHNNNDNIITPSITFAGEQHIRVELGNNNIEANRIDIYSNIVTLAITANSRGLIGVGNNPRLSIGDNSELVIMIDEDCLHSIIAGETPTVMSGFNMLNEQRRRIRLANDYDGRIRGSFVNNDYVISLVENREEVNENNEDTDFYEMSEDVDSADLNNDNNSATQHISNSNNNFNNDYSDLFTIFDNSAVIEEEEEREETTNNNNNLVGNSNDIIHHILNPNANDRYIFIIDSVTISQITDNSQIFDRVLSLLRNNYPRFNNYPLFRIIHNEERENNNESIIDCFLVTENLRLYFRGQSDRETRITFQDGVINHFNNNNIRPSLIFRRGIFRFELGSNIVEVSNFNIHNSATVNLIIAINSEGIIGGIRGVGNRPRLDIDGGTLNIKLDESSIANMEENRDYLVLSEFRILDEDISKIIFNNGDRRLVDRFDENGNYYISLNTIYNILNLDDDEMPISITNDVTISQITDSSQVLNIASFLLENNCKPLGDQPIFRLSYDGAIENNNRNITCFILGNGIGIDFIGQPNRETTITVLNSIAGYEYDNIQSYIRFRDGSFRVELGSNSMEANDFYIFDAVTFMIAINNEGLIGGLRGIGGTDSSLLRPTLYLSRNSSRLNIMLDENSIANMMPGIAYKVTSRLVIRPEHRDKIGLLNNVAGLISYFDEDGNYVISNSRLSFTGWQLNSMSTQLQFVSNLNPEVSDLSGSEGRYSMYYVNENTQNTSRLDYITSSDDDMEEEQGQDLADQTERVRNFLRNYRRVNRYITTIIEAAINGTEEDNENTTSLAITVEDNRVEEVEDNNENNDENINVHAIIPNNVRNNSVSDSTAVEDDEDDEELNIVPSPTLNNNINIIPTPNNNNLPNNMGMGGTFGGGSGF